MKFMKTRKRLTRRQKFLREKLLLSKLAIPIKKLKEKANTTSRPLLILLLSDCQTRRRFPTRLIHFHTHHKRDSLTKHKTTKLVLLLHYHNNKTTKKKNPSSIPPKPSLRTQKITFCYQKVSPICKA